MSDIVITRLQLEAWATAVRNLLSDDSVVEFMGDSAYVPLEQALEDMTDELADPDEIDIIDDADLYDPDEATIGWTPDDQTDELDDPDFKPTYF